MTQNSTSQTSPPIKVVLSPKTGYPCRNNLLSSRMVHAEHVAQVIEFDVSQNGISAAASNGENSELDQLLASSPGALMAQYSPLSLFESFDLLETVVKDRLSFDWVLPRKPAAKTVAVVGGRPLFDTKNLHWGSRGPFDAAHALGMSVIVLDSPGHFMEGEKYAHLRDDFIAIDTTSNPGLPERLCNALKGKNVDAIVTFSDEYVIATAQAAERMGLDTEPVDAILGAHYKDKTRKVLSTSQGQSVRLDNACEAKTDEIKQKIDRIGYPIIVKPCRGGASRGVKKVKNEAELHEALEKMELSNLAKYGILIEPYIDGPEVDANFVLWDGKVLFVELTDDFPCNADAPDASVADDFRETIMLCPTALSESEKEAIKTELGNSLVQMGFRSGVFHVEGRVQHSTSVYETRDGVFDLYPADKTRTQKPSVFLIEVNVRPPGLDCAFSTLYTCGIDLCALHLLRAVGDAERYRALAQPFLCYAQYWCGNAQIPVNRDRIVVPEDFCEKLLQEAPEVRPFVAGAEMFKHPGTVVVPVHGVEFLAYFLVYSRTSRRHVLEMYQRLLDAATVVLDENEALNN